MRVLISLLGGGLVAGLLFVLMQTLIGVDGDVSIDRMEGERIQFIRVERDERVRERQRHPPEPPPERPPPPPTLDLAMQLDLPPAQHQRQLDMPRLEGIAGGIPLGGMLHGGVRDEGRDGDVIPLVRIEPQWPREALMQGIEGWVQVAFTIRADGTVADARVIDAYPRRVFDRSTLRAIQHWRFAPRIVDGRPVERQATQTIEYRLEDR